MLVLPSTPTTNSYIFHFPPYLRYFSVGMVFTLAIYFFLSLISYYSWEMCSYPSPIYPEYSSNLQTEIPTPIHNLGGRFGIYLAYYTYQWLGIFAYSIPLFLVSSIIFILKKMRISFWLYSCWWWIIIVWLCTLVSFLERSPLVSTYFPSFGGIIGIFFTLQLPTSQHLKIVILLAIGVGIFLFIGSWLWEQRIAKKIANKEI